jgi:hypothetical protein
VRRWRVVCRILYDNDFTGPLPTELGTLDALQQLWVRLPHPPRLHACAVTGLSAAVAWGCRGAGVQGPTCACAALTHRAWTRAPSPDCGLSAAAAWGCRGLEVNSLTGTLPTELGTMDALTSLCVRCPHPPCLDACTVTGLWAERGGGV